MKKISEKRQVQLRHYNRVKKELESELKERGEWVCFFSGTPIPDHYTWRSVTWHHLAGRDGELMTDKKFLRPVFDEYHTGDSGYHNKPVSYLKTLWWWNGFLDRLKRVDYDLWQREINKLDK